MRRQLKKLLNNLKLEPVEVLTKEKGKTNLVLKVADQKGRFFLFKIFNHREKERAVYLRNEILFYKEIAPFYRQRLPLPRLVDFSLDDPPFLLLEFLSGRPLGRTAYEIREEGLSQYLASIVDFIFLIQSLKIETVKKISSQFQFLPGGASFSNYLNYFHHRRWVVEEKSLVLEMETQLEKAEGLMRKAPLVFNNQEFNGSNIFIVGKKIKFVDFDVVRIIANPASAFSYLYTAFWPNSSLQEKFGKMVIARGERLYPSFLEYFRLDFLFFRGLGILWRYYQKRKPALLLKSLREAILRKGIWEGRGKG